MALSEQDRREALALLEDSGAVISRSHFVYASGMHGPAYVNKDLLFVHPRRVEWLCRLLAQPFLGWKHGAPPNAVVGPAIGGVILAQHTAGFLTTQSSACEALYAEKDNRGGYVMKRGYAQRLRDRRVLVVEDVLTTGASARSTVEAVRACGGDVIGVAALVNRGGVTAEAVGGVQTLHALIDLQLDAYGEDACPLCKANVPIDGTVGKGAEYLARKYGMVR